MRTAMRFATGAVPLLLLLLLLLAAMATDTRATRMHQLRRSTRAASSHAGAGADLGGPVGTDRLHALQEQVSSMTQQMDGFLTAHAGDSSAAQLEHEQVQRLQERIDALQATHAEIEARHAAEVADEHAALLQLVEQQQAQQSMLQESIAHTRRLEAQLADMRAQDNQRDNPHTFDEQLRQQQQGIDMPESMDASSFLETELQLLQSPHWIEWDADQSAHAEVTDQWAPEVLLEADSEHALGADAAAHAEQPWGRPRARRTRGLPDPASFSSSADYTDAMAGMEHAENMSPQQLRQLQAQLHGESADAVPHGRRSMDEIDSLVAAGAMELQSAQQPEFHFDPSQLRTPGLQSALGNLQDEDAIHSAMMRAQDKIRLIAAELERHQAANGEHPAGIEIEMEEVGMDEPRHFN